MKVLVTADTHIPDWYHRLSDRLMDDARRSDLILLAGDIVSREVIDSLAACAPVKAVYGNFCDDELKKSLPSKKVLELSGRTHSWSSWKGPRRGREVSQSLRRRP